MPDSKQEIKSLLPLDPIGKIYRPKNIRRVDTPTYAACASDPESRIKLVVFAENCTWSILFKSIGCKLIKTAATGSV